MHLSPSKWFTLQTFVCTWILGVPFVSLHRFMPNLLGFIYITNLTVLCISHKSWTGSWGTILNFPLTFPLLNPNLFMSTIFSNMCTILICSIFYALIRRIKFIKGHQNCTSVLWCNFIIVVIIILWSPTCFGHSYGYLEGDKCKRIQTYSPTCFGHSYGYLEGDKCKRIQT